MSNYTSFKLKLIYVFRINDEAHKGCLKIGEATIEGDKHSDFKPNSKDLNAAARARINQYTQTAGISYDLLHTEIAFKDFKGIGDHDVHKVLRRSGVKQKFFDTTHKKNEWFICNLETAKAAIAAALNGESAINTLLTEDLPDPISFRDEQRQAINDAVKRFRAGHSKFLWNAKMRFGKTLCALQVVKEMQFKRVIIFTHRPDVLDGWHEDFGKIFFEADTNYRFCAKRLGLELSEAESRAKADAKASYIYFASTQDLRGSQLVGGKFDKNDDVFATKWDLVIIDEAHEGLQTELGRNVRSALCGNGTHQLLLSGTPFNLFDEFGNDDMFTWDYVMEQKAKADWTVNHALDSNPYEVLPIMHILTFSLGEMLQGETEYADIDDKAFNFREFFRTYTGDPKVDHCAMPDDKQQGDFVHEHDVKRFLKLLVTPNEENNMPFATEYNRNNFRHTLWMVPGVKEGAALAKLLNDHNVFGQFTIVNVAGDGGIDDEESNEKALEMVRTAMTDKPEQTRTITLSCGKLTTGVNIKPWTAVFMLAGTYSTSASNYMQTIFRVQTPATIGGRMKTDCYVFDFAPDRTLKVMAEAAQVSARAMQKDGEQLTDRQLIGRFLNFCPIISYDGTEMKHYDVNKMMEHLKRVYVDRVVNNGFEDGHLYNEELLKLDNIALEEFNRLKVIIGQTKAQPKANEVDINNEGFTDEEYEREKQIKNKPKRQRTPEEEAELERLKEKKKNRANAISILRGISIRMPLMIYGAELADDEEITIENFADKVDDSSWEEFMPHGVTKEIFAKFIKYYDPDIFRAAGRQIRDMARAADSMTITERVQRIAHIFNSFRNPDKETVLTPWRVVNMHMSDCLGGYCFYDHDFNETISEPRFVDRGEVTRNVFAPSDTHVLEINSKSGLYPLYIAYSIFRYRLDNKIGVVDNEQALWDSIIKENLFIVCKTPMAKSITRRTLRGFRSARVNARYFDDLINQIRNKPDNFVKRMSQGNNYWKANANNYMKFNAIIGNPPYMFMDGGAGASATPIYNNFVNIGKKLNPQYLSMITPSRWFAGGKGLDTYRTEMMKDKRIRKIFNFLNGKDCFPSSSTGSVNYFLWDSSFSGECEFHSLIAGNDDVMTRPLDEFDILISHNKGISIIHKVLSCNQSMLTESVKPYKPFGLRSYVRGTSEPFQDCVRLYSSGGISYIEKNKVTACQDIIPHYKVMSSYLIAEHAGEHDKNGQYRVLSRTEIIKPNEICTESYLIIYNSLDKKKVENCLAYCKTKLFRFLLLQSVSSIHLINEVFRFVPMQDFSEGWTDEKLYKKYGLTDDEIAHIESMIKPMK